MIGSFINYIVLAHDLPVTCMSPVSSSWIVCTLYTAHDLHVSCMLLINCMYPVSSMWPACILDPGRKLHVSCIFPMTCMYPESCQWPACILFPVQCLRISAKDIVEDMKLCMTGKWGALRAVGGDAPPRRGRDHIPPPPLEKAPEPPMHNGYRGDYMHSE